MACRYDPEGPPDPNAAAAHRPIRVRYAYVSSGGGGVRWGHCVEQYVGIGFWRHICYFETPDAAEAEADRLRRIMVAVRSGDPR